MRAFRGSKDGYLFFLPTGILWAFKKPLVFVPHERVVAVSYTSVLQRTFDLCVEIAPESENENENARGMEIEFSMLDQEDFPGIDEYVKRHGLLDRSMAEQRKAKRANVNVVRDEDGNVVGTLEAGELAKAGLGDGEEGVSEGQGGDLLDDEDEDEEDYDPGSEGDSEGEGESSSEEEEDDGEGEGGDDEEEEEDGEEGEES